MEVIASDVNLLPLQFAGAAPNQFGDRVTGAATPQHRRSSLWFFRVGFHCFHDLLIKTWHFPTPILFGNIFKWCQPVLLTQIAIHQDSRFSKSSCNFADEWTETKLCLCFHKESHFSPFTIVFGCLFLCSLPLQDYFVAIAEYAVAFYKNFFRW